MAAPYVPFSSPSRRPTPTLALRIFFFLGIFYLLHYIDYEVLSGAGSRASLWDEREGIHFRNGEINGSSSSAHSSEHNFQVGHHHDSDQILACSGPKIQENEERKKWETLRSLNGPPTELFRDNLRNDTHYITSWSNAGFNNQFISYVNMVYLATLSERVPIIPPFAPDHHISSSAGIIPFGDLFDLDHLRAELRVPILEWRDVKSLPPTSDPNPYPYASSSRTPEPLGCWSTNKPSEREPVRAENVVNHLGVDVSYTRVPSFVRLRPSNPDEPHVIFSPLASLIFPRTPIAPPDSFERLYMAPAPRGHVGPPDSTLACFDAIYYVTSGVEAFEWQFGWSPAWRVVGKHVRFAENMIKIGLEYLRGVLRIGEKEIPPFIAVHIRRGDFRALCNTDNTHGNDNCYPPLSSYKKHVEDLKEELLRKRELAVETVLVMSDETSPAFWEETTSFGWLHINHTDQRTQERFGEWYPPLIDIIVQSFASGFVGTEGSTFSLISQRRVQDWNRGFVRRVSMWAGI